LNSINFLIKLYKLNFDWLPTNSKHRVFPFLLLYADNEIENPLINAIPQDIKNDLSNLVLLTYVLTLRVICWQGSSEDITFSDNKSTIINIVLQYIDKSEYSLNNNDNILKHPDINNSFRSIIYTCKAAIFTLTKQTESLFWARKSLSIIKNSRLKALNLFNSCSILALIFKSCAQYDLEQESRFIHDALKSGNFANIHYDEEKYLCPIHHMEHNHSSDHYGVDISDVNYIYETSNPCSYMF